MAGKSLNRAELIGNLTKDPEIRYTPSGTAVATFTIATNRSFVSEGEKKEETDFHRIVAWAKLAELCSQLLKKGNKVYVAGRIQNRSWDGPDGEKKYMTEINIDDMILLTSARPAGEEQGGDYPTDAPAMTPPPVSEPSAVSRGAKKSPPKSEEPAPQETVNDDDLPF